VLGSAVVFHSRARNIGEIRNLTAKEANKGNEDTLDWGVNRVRNCTQFCCIWVSGKKQMRSMGLLLIRV